MLYLPSYETVRRRWLWLGCGIDCRYMEMAGGDCGHGRFWPGWDVMMRRSISPRAQVKRLDSLLGMPLARFRRAIADISDDELAALEARIALQQVRNRWARGSHGSARLRAPHELALLGRRETALQGELERRVDRAPAPIQLVLRDTGVQTLVGAEDEQRAA